MLTSVKSQVRKTIDLDFHFDVPGQDYSINLAIGNVYEVSYNDNGKIITITGKLSDFKSESVRVPTVGVKTAEETITLFFDCSEKYTSRSITINAKNIVSIKTISLDSISVDEQNRIFSKLWDTNILKVEFDTVKKLIHITFKNGDVFTKEVTIP